MDQSHNSPEDHAAAHPVEHPVDSAAHGAPHGTHAEGVGHSHPSPNYWAVFWALFILTAFEVWIGTYVAMPKIVLILGLVFLAIVKAALVGWYFMHLKYEKFIITLVTVIPALMGVIFVASMVLFESWGDGFVPK